MKQLITEPQKIPLLLRIGIWVSEKVTGKRMAPARLLTWSPRLALGAAFFESLVVHKDKSLSQRLIKLVRIQVSFFVACPFCSDMNSFERNKYSISDEEISVLRGNKPLEAIDTFSSREKLAIDFSKRISNTPLNITDDFIAQLKREFDDREILVLSATVSQVNYWARLIQSLGVAPAGFCSLSGE